MAAEAQVKQAVLDTEAKEKENQLIANLENAISKKLKLPAQSPPDFRGEENGLSSWQETQARLQRDIKRQWETEVLEPLTEARRTVMIKQDQMNKDIERVMEILKPKPPPTPPPEEVEKREEDKESDAKPTDGNAPDPDPDLNPSDANPSDAKGSVQPYARLQEKYREMKKFADEFKLKLGEEAIRKLEKKALRVISRPLSNSLLKVSKYVGNQAELLLGYQKQHPDTYKYILFRMSERIVQDATNENATWLGHNIPYGAFLSGLKAFMKNNDLENYLFTVLSNACPYVVPYLENEEDILSLTPENMTQHIKLMIERGLRFYMSLVQVYLTEREKSQLYGKARSFMKSTGDILPLAEFQQRMTGLFGGFRRAWTWIATVTNHGNHPLTANMLQEWILDCAPTLRRAYGQQFDKILIMIANVRERLLQQTAERVTKPEGKRPIKIEKLENAASVGVMSYIHWLCDINEQRHKPDIAKKFRMWRIEQGGDLFKMQ